MTPVKTGSDAHSIPVVITRPLAQATHLANQIAAIGRQVIVFPLLEIAEITDAVAIQGLQSVFANLESYALVVFVSPNAIDAACQFIQSWPRSVMIGVIGEGSRMALARHDISAPHVEIVYPHGDKMDSEELLKVLPLSRLRGKRILLVRGQNGRDLLMEKLKANGSEVELVSVYRRLAPALDATKAEQLRTLLASDNEWVITSSEALRNLLAMSHQVAGDEGVVKMLHKHILISHHRIAETASLLGFSYLTQTGSGDECLVAALQSRP